MVCPWMTFLVGKGKPIAFTVCLETYATSCPCGAEDEEEKEEEKEEEENDDNDDDDDDKVYEV